MQPSVDSSSAATGAAVSSRFFYGWYIAFAAVAIYFMTNGATISVPPVFYPAFIKEFRATEAAVSLCGAITLLLAGLLAPVAGTLIDRFGVRRLMRRGMLLLATSVTLYPFVGAVWHLYILHALFAVGLILCGLIINVVLLSRWFVVRRGLVIGLLVAGSSMAGAILPKAVAPIIADPQYGWRWGYGVIAALVWLIAMPLTFLVVKEDPREVGQCADGLPPRETTQASAGGGPTVLPGMTFQQALRTGVLWFLALGSAFIWFAILAVQNHLVIYLKQDLGLSIQQAANYLSLLFWFSIAGKSGFGYLSDRLTKRSVMVLTTALLLIGSLFLLEFDRSSGRLPFSLVTNSAQLHGFTILFGLGYGGTFSLIQLMVPECFGPRELGRILGIVTLIDTFGAFAGITLTGILRTSTGSYLIPFLLVVIVSLLGLINVWFVRPLPYDQ
ncbi:MAG: MFS transporter [Acidobacteria bacterium]|nr:MFS transporter [Acidobacteriota bacterium]